MAVDLKEVLGKNIKHYLAVNGMNQSELAQALGVSKATVTTWCKGEKYPRIDFMHNIANVLNVPVTVLTGEKVVDEVDSDVEQLRQQLKDDPEYRILFKTAANVSKEDIMQAVRILKALKGDD